MSKGACDEKAHVANRAIATKRRGLRAGPTTDREHGSRHEVGLGGADQQDVEARVLAADALHAGAGGALVGGGRHQQDDDAHDATDLVE